MADETPKHESPRLSLFRNVPGSIKTLRRFYKSRLGKPKLGDFRKELIGESERASILLIATLLDDALTYRISQALSFTATEEEYDYIFRFEGPLGTFSARLEVACLFGIIEDDTYQELEIIRELRNACAHSKHPTVFSDSVVANAAKRIFDPLGVMPIPSSDAPDNLKAAFLMEGIFLFQALIEGSREAGLKKFTTVLEKLPRPPTVRKRPKE
jgi:hypothetical protein